MSMKGFWVISGIVGLNIIYGLILWISQNDITGIFTLVFFSIGLVVRYFSDREKVPFYKRCKGLYISVMLFIGGNLVYVVIKALGWANIYTTTLYIVFILLLAVVLYMKYDRKQKEFIN